MMLNSTFLNLQYVFEEVPPLSFSFKMARLKMKIFLLKVLAVKKFVSQTGEWEFKIEVHQRFHTLPLLLCSALCVIPKIQNSKLRSIKAFTHSLSYCALCTVLFPKFWKQNRKHLNLEAITMKMMMMAKMTVMTMTMIIAALLHLPQSPSRF